MNKYLFIDKYIISLVWLFYQNKFLNYKKFVVLNIYL